MRLGTIVAVGEGALIIGRIITVIVDAAAAVVGAVGGAAVPCGGNQGILTIRQRTVTRVETNRHHPPRQQYRRQ